MSLCISVFEEASSSNTHGPYSLHCKIQKATDNNTIPSGNVTSKLHPKKNQDRRSSSIKISQTQSRPDLSDSCMARVPRYNASSSLPYVFAGIAIAGYHQCSVNVYNQLSIYSLFVFVFMVTSFSVERKNLLLSKKHGHRIGLEFLQTSKK